VTHSQIYGLQLDQSSSVFSTAVIPEPNVGGLVLAGAFFFLICRRARVVA
jgi:Na+/glutamate symporter